MVLDALIFIVFVLTVLVLALGKRKGFLGDYEYYFLLIVLVLFVCSVSIKGNM